MSKILKYGWKAYLLAHHTVEDLCELERQVKQEHANPRNDEGRVMENGKPTIFLYDEKGRKKLDAISWAFYHKAKRAA